MKNKILTITKKEPKEVILPDGLYMGLWSGSCIDILYKENKYELETELCIKGINIPVIVEIKDGIATFDKTLNYHV